MRKYTAQVGQALVLVLLSLAVVLTLVLFVLARSTTDIAVSSSSEEATRAFSAAEAGIENALVIGAGNSSPVDIGNASYTSEVSSFAEGATEFNYPIKLSSGDNMIVWFATHLDNGQIDPQFFNNAGSFSGDSMTVCWGNEGTPVDSNAPAVEVSVFYENSPGSPATTQIARGVYDPSFGSRVPDNNFSASGGTGCTIDGVNYAFQQTLSFGSLGAVSNGLEFARVRLFYNPLPQPLGIKVTGDTLPSQGADISSTGTAGESNRKVRVFQGWPAPPPVLQSAIYSPAGLVKSGSSSELGGGNSTAGSFSASVASRVITLSYSDISDPTVFDWVGFYTPGDSDSNFLDWVNIRSSGTCTKNPGDGFASGSCTYDVPLELPAGTYDVRLFSNNDYILMATASLTIPEAGAASLGASATTDGIVTINFADIASPTVTDWVGLFNPGDADTLPIFFGYTQSSGVCSLTYGDGAASGSCQLGDTGYPVGNYDVRLFSNNTTTRLATTTLEILAPTPTPTPTPVPTPVATPGPTVAPTATP